MIPAVRLVVDFDRKFDRFSSNSTTVLRLEDKLAMLNEAQEIYFENMVALAELNDKVKNSLRVLEEKNVSLKKLADKKNYTLFEKPENSYKFLRKSPLVYKKGCGEKIITAVSAQTDDLELMRKNYWKPSYEWEIVLINTGREGLYAWHDGQYKIVDFVVDYYKKPSEIHTPSLAENGSYVDWNGVEQSKDKNLIFSDTYSYKTIVDIAVLLAKVNIGDSSDYQLELNKILNVKNL